MTQPRYKKITFVGGPNSKGGFIRRFMGFDQFNEDLDVIGAAFNTYQHKNANNVTTTLEIWDTAE